MLSRSCAAAILFLLCLGSTERKSLAQEPGASPGGEISGRVVDSDGHAVVGQKVFLFAAEGWLPGSHPFPEYGMSSTTDNTGAYKVSGIRPGRYLAGIGIDVAVVTGAYWTPYDGGHTGRVEGDPVFARTFYPDVSDPFDAKAIDVRSGLRTSGININAGRPLKTYSVSGRIIDAESRKPMGDCEINIGHIYGTGKSGGMSESGVSRTVSDGSFKVFGLLPGRFMIGAAGECGRDKYTRMIDFDVSETDVTGLEIEALRGTSLKGRVVIKDESSPEAVQKLAMIRLTSTMATPDRGNNGYDQRETGVRKDGSFIIRGLAPGRAVISLAASPLAQEFSIVKIDHPNAKEQGSIDIGPDEAIAGLQVVLRYNSSVVQGRVEFDGGKLSPDVMIMADISCHCDGDRFGLQTPVDPNGSFVFKSLPPGTHTVHLTLFGIYPISDRKSVVVEGKAEAHVEFVLDVRNLMKNNERYGSVVHNGKPR